MSRGTWPGRFALALVAGLVPVAAGAAEPARWRVCHDGCMFGDPLAAWNRAMALMVAQPGAEVEIQVEDGTYEVGGAFYTDQAGSQGIHLIGNVAAPERVALNFTGIAGRNGSGFNAERGGRIGTATRPVDGMTLNGVGARLGRARWAEQAYGAGAFALGSGSNIYFGPHMAVAGFYYGVLADQGGRFVGDGASYRDAGDANLLARFGGVVQCRGCHVSGAAHVSTDSYGAVVTLGRNVMAEGSASVLADGAVAEGAEVACYSAHSNATLWAHGARGSGCGQRGVEAEQNGLVEANHAHLERSGVGAYADTGGRLNVDGLEVDHNTGDGVQLNGGAATGTGMSSHDNGGFGIDVLNGGRGELYGTVGLLLRNGKGDSAVQAQTGCGAAARCIPASMLILD